MARKKAPPKRAPEYEKPKPKKKSPPGKAKDGSKCFTRTNKGGAAYVTCEGSQKKAKARASLVRGGSAPVMTKKKAPAKPKPKAKAPAAKPKPQVRSKMYAVSTTKSPDNPTFNVKNTKAAQVKGKAPAKPKPSQNIDTFLEVMSVMATRNKDRTEEAGVPLLPRGGEAMGFKRTEYRDGSGKVLSPDMWIRLRKKPLTLSEFKTYLSDGAKVSRPDAKEIKEFVEKQMSTNYQMKPYLVIKGKIVGDTVVTLYGDASYLAQGDDGVGNRSITEIKKNYKEPSDVEILFSVPSFWDDHQNLMKNETGTKRATEAGRLNKKGQTTFLSLYTSLFTQREIFQKSGYRQGDRGAAQIENVRQFLGPGDFGNKVKDRVKK